MAEKVIDLEHRIPQLARRKRQRFIRQISFIVLLVVMLLVIVLYRQSELSHIQTIEVVGANYKTAEEHLAQLPLQIGDSMWFNVEDTEQAARQNSWLKSVSIERDWLTNVVVTIEEYKHVGYIAREEQYYPILENGDVVEEAMTSFVMDAPLLTDFNDDAYLLELLEQLSHVNDEVRALISQVTYTPSASDNSVVTLYMTDGYEVRALIYDFATKVNYYPSIVKQLGDIDVKGIIDLEVGSYFTSFDAEYGIRIDESTYMEGTDEAEQQDDAAAERDESSEEQPPTEEDAEEQSYGALPAMHNA